MVLKYPNFLNYRFRRDYLVVVVAVTFQHMWYLAGNIFAAPISQELTRLMMGDKQMNMTSFTWPAGRTSPQIKMPLVSPSRVRRSHSIQKTLNHRKGIQHCQLTASNEAVNNRKQLSVITIDNGQPCSIEF